MSALQHEPDDTSDSIFLRGMNCIRMLPDVRRNGRGATISTKNLKALVDVLRMYMESANTKTPPSKKLLREAALALMQEGAILSRQWDKTQLALVVLKWTLTALRLARPELQCSLFVQARVSSNNPKVLEHKCCMRDEQSEEVVSLSIASPSPIKTAARSPSASAESSKSTDEFDSPAFDNDSLQQIDAIAEQADLAAIPVHFYTPRVPELGDDDGNSPGEATCDAPAENTSTDQ